MASPAGLRKKQSIHGTFLNCFDLDGYFAISPYKDIKFGRKWEIPKARIGTPAMK